MTDSLAHTHARTQTHTRSPSPLARGRSRPRRRCLSPDHGSRAATAASPRRAAPYFERGGPRPAGMEKRAGEAAGAAASISAGAGLEPAAGCGRGPRSAAAALLGALHLVMTLVVAAARAEKEGGCHRPASPRPGAVTASSRRPLPGYYPEAGPRCEAPSSRSCWVEPRPEPRTCRPDATSGLWPHRVALVRDSFSLSPVTAISKLPDFSDGLAT